jgi:hypothetical protein
MAYDYATLGTKAQALIDKFGRSVTLTKRTTSAIDGVAGTITSTEAASTAKAVFFDYSGRETGKAFAADVVITTGDKKCIIAGVTPSLDCKVTVGADIYRVLNIKELNPGGTNLYFELMLRK